MPNWSTIAYRNESRMYSNAIRNARKEVEKLNSLINDTEDLNNIKNDINQLIEKIIEYLKC